MAIGRNREFDTPIGGVPEFRANVQSPAGIWQLDNVPAWDGEKFSPASNSGLLLAYGGLATTEKPAAAADGSVIDDWDDITPLLGTPLQMTVDPVTGLISAAQPGVYQIDFAANVNGLNNNQTYSFVLNVNGTNRNYGAIVSGSNNVSYANVSFSLSAQIAGGGTVGVGVINAGNNNYTVVSASLSVRRIG